MLSRLRNPLLLIVAVSVMAFTVWSVGESQRRSVDRSMKQSESVHVLEVALLEQQAALRGLTITRDEAFAEAFEEGEDVFAEGVDVLRRSAPADDRALLEQAFETVEEWDESADVVIDSGGRQQARPSDVLARQNLMDAALDRLNTLEARTREDRDVALARSSEVSAVLVIGMSACFALAGWLAFGRRSGARKKRRHAELAQRERQTTFAHTLQFMDSEAEAHLLVKRHLESSIAGGPEVTVLQRNNSADRLEAATPVAPDGPLAAGLVDASPQSCLAVRLGAAREGGAGDDLLQCDLCGTTAAQLSTCTPLLVQGEVIGSVLVAHDEPLDDIAREYVGDTVTQAAPIVANMRNLAIAELRASTDALTGLANRRAIQDTLRRMVAQSGRSGHAMSAIAIDLDHFKQINDRLGHDKGDDVLAAVAQMLTATLRTSDFVGRQGGEEFIALLPDTDGPGAMVAAESLRTKLATMEIPGVDHEITASFGVAVLPADAMDADSLLRQADRALYLAKELGRDRVEAAASVSPQLPA